MSKESEVTEFNRGVESEREAIVERMKRKICFGHRETGNCDHQLCWGLRDLIRGIDPSVEIVETAA